MPARDEERSDPTNAPPPAPPPGGEWVTTSLLLSQLRSGEGAAWAVFAARFRRPLMAHARRLGLRDADAEDAIQETLHAFLERLRAGAFERGKGRLGAWLFGIATNKVRQRRDAVAAQARRALTESRAGPLDAVPDERTLEDAWNAEWSAALLAEAFARAKCEFDPRTWRAFERVQRDGAAPAEAAQELGLTRNAVFIAKHRVLKRLRALVAELDDDPDSENRDPPAKS